MPHPPALTRATPWTEPRVIRALGVARPQWPRHVIPLRVSCLAPALLIGHVFPPGVSSPRIRRLFALTGFHAEGLGGRRGLNCVARGAGEGTPRGTISPLLVPLTLPTPQPYPLRDVPPVVTPPGGDATLVLQDPLGDRTRLSVCSGFPGQVWSNLRNQGETSNRQGQARGCRIHFEFHSENFSEGFLGGLSLAPRPLHYSFL